LKNIFRHEHTDNNPERNNGYLLVVTPDAEPLVLSNDTIDHQQTQHAQPCVQINEDSFDLNQIQYTSISPDLLPPEGTSLVPYILNYDIRANHDLDGQLTRSSVECGAPQDDSLNIEEIPMSHMVSASSTNSSSHEYTGIDRSTLDDIQYSK
jgi:hypothetical protein